MDTFLMKLGDYLETTEETMAAFSRRIGHPRSTVNNYLKGRRMPRPREMVLIFLATDFKVQPNDWFDLAAIETLARSRQQQTLAEVTRLPAYAPGRGARGEGA